MPDHNWLPQDEEDYSDVMQRRTEELFGIEDLPLDESGFIESPVMPLRDVVVYPHMISPLFVGRDKTLWAIDEAHNSEQTILAFTQIDSRNEDPGPKDFFPIGVEIAVGRLLSMPDGSNSALIQARRRVALVEFTQFEPYLRARVRPLYENVSIDRKIDATMRSVLELFHRCVDLDRSLPEEAYLYALNIEEPGWLADMIATSISPNIKERTCLAFKVKDN